MFPVDTVWHQYQGYNDIKRKKLKEMQLSSYALQQHAEALLQVCMKPCMESTVNVTGFRQDIQGLADCFLKYSAHLNLQLKKQTDRQKQTMPPRLVCEDVSVQHRHAVNEPDSRYLLLDEAVTTSGILNPVLFVEEKHLVHPFTNRMQRLRFIDNLYLSVDVDLVKYCPGGSICVVVFVYKVEPFRSENEAITQSAQIVARLKRHLPEFHT